jgi:hypothetical protein
MISHFVTGQLQAGSTLIPVVTTRWNTRDYLGALKARWSLGRMSYRVKPGVYAVGLPNSGSHVFVTGNYKLSFDHLRKALAGLDAWILVINTKGINVWCAAGKKTFSAREVVRQIRIHHLTGLVDHRELILPQLSAPGVAAHEVKKLTGFRVIFGPVRASDIKSFIDAGLTATTAMRTVTFTLGERMKLIPVDIFYGRYYLILVPLLFFIFSGLNPSGYSVDMATGHGWKAVVSLAAGYLSGCVLTPVMLPIIPFRRFALKGLTTGLLVALLLALTKMLGGNLLEILSWFLMLAGVSSFMAMNFTGSSTFTSLSGVQKEMKLMLPVQITLAGLGLIGWIVSRFMVILPI